MVREHDCTRPVISSPPPFFATDHSPLSILPPSSLGTTILLNKTAVLLTSPSQVQLKGSHLSATTPADVPTTSSPSTSMQPPHANGTALAAREIETGKAAAGRGNGSFVEGNGYPEAQAFQVGEEGEREGGGVHAP